jgi:hypothetical protein
MVTCPLRCWFEHFLVAPHPFALWTVYLLALFLLATLILQSFNKPSP